MLRKDLCIIIDESFSTTLFLSKTYNAHINGEIASTVKADKYLYKYVYRKDDSIREKMIKGSSMKFSSILMVDMSVNWKLYSDSTVSPYIQSHQLSAS